MGEQTDRNALPGPIGPLDLPADAAQAVRARCGLAPDAALRIAFISGPGDVRGTFGHWLARRQDPRIPVVTYSSMFYDLVSVLGAEALMITAAPQQAEAEAEAGASPDLPVRFHFETLPPWSGRLGWWRQQRARLAQARRVLGAYQPHILLVGSDFPWDKAHRLPARAARYLTLHSTLWQMGARPTSLRKRLKLALMTRGARKLDGAIGTSPEAGRQIAALGGPRLPVVVEYPQALPGPPPAQRRAPQARRLLYLGRLVENKGIFELLDAFATLRARFPDAELDFAGAGAAGPELERRIAALGTPQVRFLGLLDAEGVHQALAAHDLLVCPTRPDFLEGLALVCLEAALHGLPTVLTEMVPARDLLGEGALTVRGGDTAALAEGLAALMGNDAEYRRRAEAAAAAAAAMHDPARSWGSQLYRLFAGTTGS